MFKNNRILKHVINFKVPTITPLPCRRHKCIVPYSTKLPLGYCKLPPFRFLRKIQNVKRIFRSKVSLIQCNMSANESFCESECRKQCMDEIIWSEDSGHNNYRIFNVSLYVMFWVIWYHLYHLRTVKNTHAGLLHLACNFIKINTPPWVFFTFFKLYNW